MAALASWARGLLAGAEKDIQILLEMSRAKLKDFPEYTETDNEVEQG